MHSDPDADDPSQQEPLLCLTLAPKSAHKTFSRSPSIPARPSGSGGLGRTGRGGGTRFSSVEPTSCCFLLLLGSLQPSTSLTLSLLSSPQVFLHFAWGCGCVTRCNHPFLYQAHHCCCSLRLQRPSSALRPVELSPPLAGAGLQGRLLISNLCQSSRDPR